MAIKIFDILRAKSPDEMDQTESLKEHLKNCLDQVVIIHDVIKDMEPSIELQLFKEKGQRKQFFKALTKAAILHDFGKIDYGFQRRMFNEDERENSDEFQNIKEFFRNFFDVHFTRHEVLSAIFASLLLKDESDKENIWHDKIITAILFHHYNKYYVDLREFPEFIFDDHLPRIVKYLEFIEKYKNDFETSYLDLLNNFAHKFYEHDFVVEAINELKKDADWDRITRARKKLEEDEDDLSDFTWFYVPPNAMGKEISQFDKKLLNFLLLLGELRRADYASSGRIEIETGLPTQLFGFASVAKTIGENIREKLKGEDFKFWQKEMLEKVENHEKLILIAPTGSGKTEFSILWSAKNPRKFLYTLPLRVALNDLFLRFRGYEEEEKFEKGYFKKDVVDILHSTSFIEYLKEEFGEYLDIENKLNSAKLLASPVLLTTPDQIFLTSLNYYGSDKILAVYPLSNIVLDEIQTYNPEMAAVIIRTLQLVNSLGGNILVMTATFPPYFKKFLVEQLGLKQIDVSEKKLEIKNLKCKRHRIKVIPKNLFKYETTQKEETLTLEKDSYEKLKKAIVNKQNVLIVLNNVKKAIKLYEKLEECYGEDEIFLLHSRIIEKYKSERIKEIKDRLEKKERVKERVIVIATQIIEASVDFDFDFMITEISSIDSQIQRWGRVYRRPRGKDYESEEPNILIFAGEKGDDGKLKLDRGTQAIYDREVLEATREILLQYQGIPLSYVEEKEMVQKTFELEINGKKLNDKYVQEIEKNLEFLKYYTASKRSEAQRIFRELAGFNVVVPALMEDEEEWVKEFAKVIKRGEDLPWRKILENIGVIKENEEENKIKEKEREWRWRLKAKLYEYSFNLPQFLAKKYNNRITHEFKGFGVLQIGEKDKKDEKENLKKYGVDKLPDFTNIESMEISKQ